MTSIAGEEGIEIDHATSTGTMMTSTATAKDDTKEIDLSTKYCVDSMEKDDTDDDSYDLQDVAALPPTPVMAMPQMDPQERDKIESADNLQPNKNMQTKRKLAITFILLVAVVIAIAVGVPKNREGSTTTIAAASSALDFNPETDCADVEASFSPSLPTSIINSPTESPINIRAFSNDMTPWIAGSMDGDFDGERRILTSMDRSLTSMNGSAQKKILLKKEKKMVRRKLIQDLTEAEEERVSTHLIFLLMTRLLFL